MISLFEHNRIAYESAVAMLDETGKTAIVHPTGTGKSFIGFKLCEDNPDKVICWLSPSDYIFKTQLENLKNASDGYEPENIVFYTYAKLMGMGMDEIAEIKPDYIVLDEFHRCGAEMWGQGVQNVLSAYPNVPILGLSATAIRYLDNQRDMADELFDGNVASEITLGEAIVRGILNAPKYVLSVFSYQKDLERYERRVYGAQSAVVRNTAEKYLNALRRALDKADGLDVIFDRHMEDRTGKYIVFCANKEHMDEMQSYTSEWFSKVDKNPIIYSVYTDDRNASKSFQAFKEDKNDNHLRLLYCIDALNEGIHVDNVSGVILLRPTESPIIYKQQIGRALAAGKKGTPVIFDIINNIENLYSIGSLEEEMNAAITYYQYLGDGKEIVNDRFTVLDEIKDCRELFDRLNDTLTASWDMMYELAKEYYEKYGDLEVPSRYKTESSYALGNWICAQRRVRIGEAQGILTKDRIARLDKIGMRWDSVVTQLWNRYYDACKDYYEQHGSLKMTAKHVMPDGTNLGSWLARIRKIRKNGSKSEFLTLERIQMLDELGMIWDVPNYTWERNYGAVLEYYRIHGDINIPANLEFKGIKLGLWFRSLRLSYAGKYGYAPLTEDQIHRMDELGMRWEIKQTHSWDYSYQKAKEYSMANGNLAVPLKYITPDGFKLGKWLSIQRRENNAGKLPAERIRLLDAINMTWAIDRKNPWNRCYELVKEYYEQHGDLKVPEDYVADGIWLGKWIKQQRYIYLGKVEGEKLTAGQVKKLNDIGMRWGNAFDEAWEKRYQAAKSYYEENGHLTFPNGSSMDVWMSEQRRKREQGKLTQEQIDKLDALGMVWNFESGWERGYRYAKAYYEEHGHLNALRRYKTKDGFGLGMWICKYRTAHNGGKSPVKITNDQIKALEAIGMTW